MENPRELHKPTDKRAAGVYMPRVFLENFRIGVLRTYIYQLIDEKDNKIEYEKHFGMFGIGGSADPKPAANAMHYMNSKLADGGSTAKSFKTGKLDFSLPGKPSNVRYVLLQKSSGNFQLVMWRTDSVYDNAKRVYTEPSSPTNVTVAFGRGRTVTANYPAADSGSGTTQQVAKNAKSATLRVGARATVFDIR